MFDEFYIEEGYVEQGYFEVVRNITDLAVVATLTADVGLIKNADCNLTVSSNLSADGNVSKIGSAVLPVAATTNIEIQKFRSKWLPRPRNPQFQFPISNGTFTIDSTQFQHGNASLKALPGVVGNVTSSLFYSTNKTTGDFSVVLWYRLGNIIDPGVSRGSAPFTFLRFVNNTTNTFAVRHRYNGSQVNLNFVSGANIINSSQTVGVNAWNKLELTNSNAFLVIRFNDVIISNGDFSSGFLANRIEFLNGEGLFETMWFDSFTLRQGDNQLFGANEPTNTFGVTQNLYTWNNDFNDVLGSFDLDGSATLTSKFTLSTSLGKNQLGAATLPASFNVLATGEKFSFIDGEADLDVISNLTAAPTKIKNSTSQLESVFDLTSNADRISTVEINLQSSFDTTCEVSKILETAATLVSQTTLTADYDLSKVASADLISEFNINITADRVRQHQADLITIFTVDVDADLIPPILGSADLTAEFTQTANGGFIRSTTLDVISEFDLQATVDRLQLVEADLESAFDIDVEATVISPILAEAELESAFDIQATVGFLESATIELEAVATKLTAAGIVGEFFVPMDVNASIVADANVIRDAEAQFTVEFSQNAEVSRTRTDSAVLESESEVNCLTGFIRDLNASLVGEFELSAIPEGIVPGTVSMNAQFSTEIISDLILGTTVDLQALFDFGSTSNAVFDSSTTLNAAVLLDAQAQVFKIIEFETSMESQFQLTAIGAVSNVRQYVYTIPRENRTLNIQREDRTIKVRR